MKLPPLLQAVYGLSVGFVFGYLALVRWELHPSLAVMIVGLAYFTIPLILATVVFLYLKLFNGGR